MILNEYERIDELLIQDLKIIQDTRGFLYGTDAVLLSDFARIKANGRVLDLCCGSGIIPILLSAKSKAKEIVGIEYFDEVAEMARRSVKLNHLSCKIKILTGDVKDYKNLVEHHSFDTVTVNPPYKVLNSGAKNLNDFKTAARHEVLCTLEDCVAAAGYALKFGGKLAMVHRADRLSDVIYSFKSSQIEPKRLTFVLAKLNLPPKLILVEGIKGGKSELKVLPPILLNK